MWCIYAMEYYLAVKKEWNNAIGSNMINLEIVILSEISQKDKYHMTLLICRIWKEMIKTTYKAEQTHRLKELKHEFMLKRGWGENGVKG